LNEEEQMGNLGHGIDGRRRALFVAGLSRSGSTALDFILGNRPGGFSLGEIYAWYRPFRDHHVEPRCTCGQRWYECLVWQQVGHPKARHLHRTVAYSLAVTTVVDSSKDLSWIRDAYQWVAADGLEPHVVLSWREPQGLAYSYWKRGDIGGLGGRDKPSWMTNVEQYVRRLDDLGVGYHVVPFDQLITDPATTLEKLHSAIGMEPCPGQERFWENDYHSMFGSGGTREQLQAQSARLEHPELPAAFLEYWDGLPAAWRQDLDELNVRLLSGHGASSATGRLPPWWYVRSRLVAYRQELAVRWRRAAERFRSAKT
jgi:hypothetical protein